MRTTLQRLRRQAGFCALLLLATPFVSNTAVAQELRPSSGTIDGYYIPTTDLSVKASGQDGDLSGSDNGKGFGFKATLPLARYFALNGEYQAVKYDSDLELAQYRIGPGFAFNAEPLHLQALVYADYVNYRFDGNDIPAETADGFGGHARLTYYPLPQLSIYGEGGYLNVKDDSIDQRFNGYEFDAGAAFMVTRWLGLFGDYRYTKLDGNGDSGVSLTFKDVRVGVRLALPQY